MGMRDSGGSPPSREPRGRFFVCALRSCLKPGSAVFQAEVECQPDDLPVPAVGQALKDNRPGCSRRRNEGEPSMCDYSLHHVANRPAKIEDRLVTSTFHSITRGFSAVGEPNVAVCLLPGTELAFE